MNETWWINSAKKDCVGVAPMTCFEIQRNADLDPEGWELFYSQIAGFDYEPGHVYHVVVEIQDRPPPLPADVSSKTYTLVEVLSKTADPALRLTNLWKVVSVGDLEDPRNAKGQPLVFEFNASMRTYAGDLGCNRIRGALAENDGTRLKLGVGMATLMNCADMTVEDAVSSALAATRRYELSDGLLRFLGEEGEELMTFAPGD
jgi:heat shock protein HslJ